MSVYHWICVLVMALFLASCNKVSVDAGEEAVLISKPWFFGHGGVDEKPVRTGFSWVWFTTDSRIFKIIPQKYQVDMEDLISNDNTPLDFHTVIITQIKEGKTPVLLQNYGEDWFNTNIYNYYCNRVRDYVSQHSPFDLMSNREVLNDIDKKVLAEMQEYLLELSKGKEFPVEIRHVIIGKASPNTEQLAEMNRTAKAVQAKQTQEREVEVQMAREKAERQRAKADKAYMEEMHLSSQDFINLKWIETVASKKDANIDVMVGPATSMWNVRRE